MKPDDQLEQKLDMLWRAYREASPDPEPGADFTPGLWRKIESQRGFTLGLPLMARRFATVAAAICTLLLLMMLAPFPQSSAFSSGTYVDILSDEHELMAYSDIDRPDFPTDSALQ